MKNRIISKLALSALFLFFLVSTGVKAQPFQNPYIWHNHLGCPVTIQYQIFDVDPITGACTLPCDAGVVTIPAMPPFPPPFLMPWGGTCAPGCRIEVTIIDIGGTPIPAPSTASFPPIPPMLHQHVGGPDPSGCSPSGNFNMHLHPHGGDINP